MKYSFFSNTFWTLTGNIVKSALSFIVNIITARLLTADQFGQVNYSISIISMVSAVTMLGLDNIITKEIADDEENADKLLRSAARMQVVAAIIAIVMIALLSGRLGADGILIFINSLSLIFSASSIYIYWFRYKNRAKFISIVRVASLVISAVFRIVAIVVFKNLYLYMVGVILESFSQAIMLAIAYGHKNAKHGASKGLTKRLLRSSLPFVTSALLISIYGQTDKIMINSMIDSASVAHYSVALTLAGAFYIIPAALVDSFRPEIMREKARSKTMYERRLRQLYFSVFWLSCLYCVLMTILAKPIILILYGAKYAEAIPVLALVVWYSAFSYFGSINNLYIIAEKQNKWVQVITVAGALTNVLLNLILIPKMGIIGAALASLLTQIVANFIVPLLIPKLRGMTTIMLSGIAGRGINIKEYIKIITKNRKA